MKRYRVLRLDFDTRATILNEEIKEDWEASVRERWRLNQIILKEGLVAEYGATNYHKKIANFKELGAAPFSIVAFHNIFFRQSRDAFVVGAYYPALASACALGERILNHLIIKFREDYRHTPQYKRVYNKNSFDNWFLAIETLESWEIFLPEVANKYKEFKITRDHSIHFNPEIDKNDREMAMEALGQLKDIINKQFGVLGGQPWYISDITYAAFIRKSFEEKPFVKRVILPNCVLVGPKHRLEKRYDKWIAIDDFQYEDREITDNEFADLLNKERQNNTRKNNQKA